MKVTVVPAWIRMRAGEYVYSLLLSPALTVKTLMDYARSGPIAVSTSIIRRFGLRLAGAAQAGEA